MQLFIKQSGKKIFFSLFVFWISNLAQTIPLSYLTVSSNDNHNITYAIFKAIYFTISSKEFNNKRIMMHTKDRVDTVCEWVKSISQLFVADKFPPSNFISSNLPALICSLYKGIYSLIQAVNSCPPTFSNSENDDIVHQLFSGAICIDLYFALSELNFSSRLFALAIISCSREISRTAEASCDTILFSLWNEGNPLNDHLPSEWPKNCFSALSSAERQRTSASTEIIRSSDELMIKDAGTCR